jgi:putative flavoprotein involved in K+ transport
MPAVHFALTWPDGITQACYSPSTVIEQVLVEGGRYPVPELAARCREGLTRAAERVREVRGFACTAAPQQLDEIELRVAEVAGRDGAATVTVQRLRRANPPVSYPAPDSLSGQTEVAVVGGGHAGLAVSWCLQERGVEHLVLERDRIASSWCRERWDEFCLVTPNWQCRLPGYRYEGGDPDGFMLRDEIVAFVEGYAASFGPPLCEGVGVERVERTESGFAVTTSRGTVTADQVVLAVGGYHRPTIPAVANALPNGITQLHSSGYRNTTSLPGGAILVVGSGQSGAQIAEDLHLAGRDVHLSVGSAPRVARFYRGRDCVAWLEDMGHYDMPIDRHPKGLAARREPNHYVTGRGGGRDIDLRAHARDGMQLHGRLLAIAGEGISFAGDLGAQLDAADRTAERIKDSIDAYIAERGLDAPVEARYSPAWSPASDVEQTVDCAAAGITTVIWATGFRSDWSWVAVPAFDGVGYPTHVRGVTTVPGLYVVGLPWLYTWGSGRFAGIERDARFVVERLAERRPVAGRAAA